MNRTHFVHKTLYLYCLCFQDLVVHVRDTSHPECDSQLEDVLTILEKQLNLKAPLMENMIEALNKADIWYALR